MPRKKTPAFCPSDFDFIDKRPRINTHQTLTIPYWRAAWSNLKIDRSVIFSLYMLTALFLLAFIGPFIWPIPPEKQFPGQLSMGPSLHNSALVLPDRIQYTPAIKHVDNTASFIPEMAPHGLSLSATPTTEYVILAWLPVTGSRGYRLFRHKYPPLNRQDLGLPLVEIKHGEAMSYMDTLMLESIRYYYSIVTVFDGYESEQFSTLTVNVKQAIRIDEAIEQGYIQADQRTQNIGKTIALYCHPLGTDYLGRDMLARLIEGTRVSLLMAIVVSIIIILTGIFYGLLATWANQKIAHVMLCLASFLSHLPLFLFILILNMIFIQYYGNRITALMAATIAFSWPTVAQLIYHDIQRIKEGPCFTSTLIMGATPLHLLLHSILPSLSGLLLITIIYTMSFVILIETFLSFIGLGLSSPSLSLGILCKDGISSLLIHPHEFILPAIVIFLTLVSLTLLTKGFNPFFSSNLKRKT